MAAGDFHQFRITEIGFGFPGRIFRSPMPFGKEPESDGIFAQYLRENIQVVVNLLPVEESSFKAERDLDRAYQQAGMKMLSLPIQDFLVPDPQEMAYTVDTAIDFAQAGKNLVVHCYAGLGRTGTFLACMAVRAFGMSGKNAIHWIRQFIPHAVENEAQMNFIVRFGERYADHKC